jgi:antitoxin MazE
MEQQIRKKDIQLVPIGNSKGIRIPKELLQKYGFKKTILLEETDKGLLLRNKDDNKPSWEETYKAMADEKENRDDVDATLQDGLEDEDIESGNRLCAAKRYLKIIIQPDKKVYFPHEVVEKSVVEEKGLVRAWREYRGMSQSEMAKRLGITQAAYSQMEKPKARLRKTTLARIAAALGVDRVQLEM